MIFEERKVSPEVLFSGAAEVGNYVVISSLKFDATKIRFNGEDVEVPAFTTPETKLYCIKKDKKNCELLFDNCLFEMAIAPFKKDKKICFSSSFLNEYLNKYFVPRFKYLTGNDDLKIKCNLLSKKEVFDEKKRLDWFKEPKHKIAMFNEYSDWWWLSDEYGDCEGDASSAGFCIVADYGLAGCSGASYSYSGVRPRFVIGAKA